MRRSVLGVLVSMATLGLLVGCHGSGQAKASADFTVDAPNALIDAPVAVSLHGVRPGAAVVITSRAVDGEQQAWTASATFTATAQGTVSLSQPATDGSYTGSNAMGLFEDMLPPASAPLDDNVFLPSGRSFPVSITAAVKGRTVASTTVQRNYPSVAEQHYRLADSGIYADLYSPKDTTVKHPAVLVFGGSEGGQDQNFTAELLAGEGYPAMALAYFKEPACRARWQDINLEYFIKALPLLRAAPGVDPRHVLVYGISRGSEAALLLGVHFPNLVNGVIAGVPSSVTYGGYPHDSRPLWLLGGKALPYAPLIDWNNPNPIDARAAVIPVEQIKGPVMMSCGRRGHRVDVLRLRGRDQEPTDSTPVPLSGDLLAVPRRRPWSRTAGSILLGNRCPVRQHGRRSSCHPGRRCGRLRATAGAAQFIDGALIVLMRSAQSPPTGRSSTGSEFRNHQPVQAQSPTAHQPVAPRGRRPTRSPSPNHPWTDPGPGHRLRPAKPSR